MSTRIAECHDITGESASKDCVETRTSTAAIERCTVETGVSAITTGDAGIKAQEPENNASIEDCCCCDS